VSLDRGPSAFFQDGKNRFRGRAYSVSTECCLGPEITASRFSIRGQACPHRSAVSAKNPHHSRLKMVDSNGVEISLSPPGTARLPTTRSHAYTTATVYNPNRDLYRDRRTRRAILSHPRLHVCNPTFSKIHESVSAIASDTHGPDYRNATHCIYSRLNKLFI